MTLPFELPVFEPGWVWLVGAGPGDPGLLSLHALNGLQQADVLVYDALVDKRILAAAKPGAELIYAGKRGGKPSPKQADISQRLVELAQANRRVLRLKGGDPFVFGRGGEEALALVEAGIPFRLVPGITAGIGGLAYAGIPATHRDVNAAVTFVTGHQAGGNVPEHLDWAALAKGSPVLVIYMAVQNLPAIVEKLLAAGRNPAEPMAIISKASTPEQSVLETTLGDSVADCARVAPPPPAMVVLGEVVKLRASLDWIGALDKAR
ncbi:MAG TPA: uroporphyrinogen-III C-methyltransferase [Alphaproteobacteria bacterium]|jgi:uroporphyrin-III C-methyltransferase